MRLPSDLLSAGSGTPVVVLPGWGTHIDAYTPMMVEISAATGQPIAGFDTLRRGGRPLPMRAVPRAITRQVDALCRRIANLGTRKVVVIGHSAGAALALAAARHQPGHFKRIILLCPAALCKDNPFSLSWRILRKTVQDRQLAKHHPDEHVRAASRAGFGSAVRFVAANPARALAEGWTLGRFCTQEMVQALRSDGLEIWLVSALDDILFTPAMMDKAVRCGLTDYHLRLPQSITHDAQLYPREIARFLSGNNQLDVNLLE